MQFKLLGILLLCMACSISHAQESFSVRIKAGLNLSDIAITNYINPDAESQYKIKTGLVAGLAADLVLTDIVVVTAELLYANKGVRANNRFNLHYVNVPLLLKYRFADRWFVEGGPELGYLVSARSEKQNVSNTWNNKLDIGLNAGIQFSLSEKISASIRYGAGFLSVIDSIDESATNNITGLEPIRYQNRVLQFSMLYHLTTRAISD